VDTVAYPHLKVRTLRYLTGVVSKKGLLDEKDLSVAREARHQLLGTLPDKVPAQV
jgi:uncharacterized membrane protein YjgN (DUF898 family)